MHFAVVVSLQDIPSRVRRRGCMVIMFVTMVVPAQCGSRVTMIVPMILSAYCDSVGVVMTA